MPRRGNVPKREILPDPMYNSVLVTKLVNSIMLDGKKGVAQKVVYGAFDIIKDKTEKDPLEVFTQAMENIMPSLEVKARRVGGATYQVPMEVRPARRQTLGLRWLTNYSRARGERTMAERLAGEIMDAANNTGCCREEARGHPQDGGVQQGFRPLPLVIIPTTQKGERYAEKGYTGKHKKYRHHGTHRCRQDHDHRAYSVLHGRELQAG